MPELPEVQTVVNQLEPSLPGRIIHSLENPNGYLGAFENGDYSFYQSFLIGKKINSIEDLKIYSKLVKDYDLIKKSTKTYLIIGSDDQGIVNTISQYFENNNNWSKWIYRISSYGIAFKTGV